MNFNANNHIVYFIKYVLARFDKSPYHFMMGYHENTNHCKQIRILNNILENNGLRLHYFPLFHLISLQNSANTFQVLYLPYGGIKSVFSVYT